MNILFTSVSSMNLEPIVTGLEKEMGSIHLCKFDKGKEEQHHHEGEVDHEILVAFDTHKPDVVIYSGPAEGKCRPFLSTFHTMRKTAKVVNLICDGGCPNWHPLIELYNKEDCFDLNVNIDGNDNWPSREKDITSVGPIDQRYYKKTNIEKVVDFGFAGGLGSLERREATDRLKQSCGLLMAHRNERWGTYNLYADFMLSCKAVFNMGKTGSGKAHHVKYRIIESALACACVFEEVNPITQKYFTPNVDYVEYKDLPHLEQRFAEVMECRSWSNYGENLQNKEQQNYSTEKFWKRVFKAL